MNDNHRTAALILRSISIFAFIWMAAVIGMGFFQSHIGGVISFDPIQMLTYLAIPFFVFVFAKPIAKLATLGIK